MPAVPCAHPRPLPELCVLTAVPGACWPPRRRRNPGCLFCKIAQVCAGFRPIRSFENVPARSEIPPRCPPPAPLAPAKAVGAPQLPQMPSNGARLPISPGSYLTFSLQQLHNRRRIQPRTLRKNRGPLQQLHIFRRIQSVLAFGGRGRASPGSPMSGSPTATTPTLRATSPIFK